MPNTLINTAVITLGCPKNTADTESVIAELDDICVFSNIEEAEIVILNSCAFLESARNEVYENLEKLEDKKVVLIGCLTTALKQDFFDKYPQVKAIVSPVNYPHIREIIRYVGEGAIVYQVDDEPLKYVNMPGKLLITPPGYAYIKIAEGCNNACAFCLIPKLRGRYRSRPMEPIIEEIKELIKIGVKEIVLVAQDSGCYGVDLYKKKSLVALLKKIIAIKDDFWVRVLYVYPERINDELLTLMAESDKICKYLDIPLQHGDPAILKAMLRPYDVKKTIEKIKNIRKIIPDVTLRTSLIAGFPGETESNFKNLLSFIKKIDFDHVGVFEYSREKGTEAYKAKKQIPDKTKRERHKKAMLVQQKISSDKNKKFIGSTQKVLIDGFDPELNKYIGRTQHFAPEVDGVVIIKSSKKLKSGSFYKVKITDAGEYDLFGSLSEL
ncbi:30S ribosomal protein S12 methylthiotransferase RimO [Candidatus Peregrinibacteria bacterium]|nr:30S ribosomal protein S12 methylthiotransferase RimO [Candidatus Peregrinibacteria bacterium]